MSTVRIALALVAGCTLSAGAAAGSWRPVPGAPDVELQLGSMQLEGARVVVWLRWWGRHPLVPELAGQGPRPPRIHRTAMRTEFDCSQRTLRHLAANTYDSSGATMFMSSTPGPLQRVHGGEMDWAYDAVCEAARAERRL